MDRTRTALREMAREDPELAARLIIQTLPAAASRIRAPLRYQLTVGDMGTWLVVVDDDGARVQPGMDGDVDFALSTDPAGLAELAAGASPLRLMLGGRVRIRGKRRRAIRLRAMSSANGLSMADALAGGAQLDPDAVYRSLAYMIDPDWTRGHTFAIAYELTGDGGGKWFVQVDDGNRVRVTTEPPEGQVAATTRVSVDTFKRLVSGEISPAQSMREQLADIEGEIYPTVLVGRWIERAQGRDDDELEREGRQRDIQSRRAGSWGGSGNGARPTEVDSAPARTGDLMSYGDLYALWERQNWRAHRPRAVGHHPARGAGEHHVETRLLLHRRGAGHGRPGPVPRRGAERRGGGVPRHPARGRGAARRVLRPLRCRGHGARGRRPARADARGAVAHAPGLVRHLRQRAARRGQPHQGEARRPRPVRGGHHRLPPGHRGRARHHGPADDPQVHRGPRAVPGLPEGLFAR